MMLLLLFHLLLLPLLSFGKVICLVVCHHIFGLAFHSLVETVRSKASLKLLNETILITVETNENLTHLFYCKTIRYLIDRDAELRAAVRKTDNKKYKHIT